MTADCELMGRGSCSRVQFISATAHWRRAGLTLKLEVDLPGSLHPSVTPSLTLRVSRSSAVAGVRAALVVRVPSWANAPNATLHTGGTKPFGTKPLGGGGGGVDAGALEDAVDDAEVSDGESGRPEPGTLLRQSGSISTNQYQSEAISPEPGTLMRVERTWREGDTLSLTLPAALRTSRLPDDRPRYRKLFALLYGPVVLACIGCLHPHLPGVSEPELLRMLEPVPSEASAQLRTLRRIEERGAPAGTLLLHADRLWVRDGRLPSPPPSKRGRGGTDLSAVTTFRVVAGLSGGDNLVSFQPFTRPGCYLTTPDTAPRGGSSGVQIELLCVSPGTAPTAAQARCASWRRHDPLLEAAHGGFHSYESLEAPGFYLSSALPGADEQSRATERPLEGPSAMTGYDVGDETDTQLAPATLQRKPAGPKDDAAVRRFAMHASFEEAIGAAAYPPAAWFLHPPTLPTGRAAATSAVVWPLSEVIDETYSVYFDLA